MDFRSWLRAAEEDALVARSVGAIAPGAAAFHWQQAIEKILKAVLVSIEAEVPRLHDLVILWTVMAEKGLVPAAEPDFADALRRVSRLAVLGRYPLNDLAPSENVTKSDLNEAEKMYELIYETFKNALHIAFSRETMSQDDDDIDSDPSRCP